MNGRHISGVSGSFFARESEHTAEEHRRELERIAREEHDIDPIDSVALAQRHERRRRMYVVVAAALMAVVGLAMIGVVRGKPPPEEHPAAIASQPTASTAPSVAPPVMTTLREAPPPPSDGDDEPAPPSAATSSSAAKPTASVASSAAPPSSAEPEKAPAGDEPKAPDPAKAKELRQKALTLLERGKYPDAIATAKDCVAADPSDANGYLYWGTALLSMGSRAEAKVVFTECVQKAKTGPVHECRQWAPPGK